MRMLLRAFLRHPRRIAGVAPASQPLVETILRPVPFDRVRVIVEWGPGTGRITQAILQRKRAETLYIGLDVHAPFVEHLQRLFEEVPNAYFLLADFRETPALLRKHGLPRADAVISTLPVSLLPHPEEVFRTAALSTRGVFVQYMYTLALFRGCWPPRWIRHYFGHYEMRLVVRNLPPALVFHCFLTPEALAQEETLPAFVLPVIG